MKLRGKLSRFPAGVMPTEYVKCGSREEGSSFPSRFLGTADPSEETASLSPTREAAIAWIVANQLGRRNLTPSQKAMLPLEIEKQLAVEAKKRQAHEQTAPGKTLLEIFPEASDTGEAHEKAAKMVGANPHYVTDAKKIEQDAPEILDHVKQGTLKHSPSQESRCAPRRATLCGH